LTPYAVNNGEATVPAYHPGTVELFAHGFVAPELASESKFCVTGMPSTVILTCACVTEVKAKKDALNSASVVLNFITFLRARAPFYFAERLM
jgi:hypothetical protein